MQKPRIEEYYLYSKEKTLLKNELNQILRPRYDYALDIGAGNGEISSVLASRTENLTLCEVNPFYASTLSEKFPTAKIDILPIQNLELGKYDCILLSQSLYYHAKENWLPLIEKLFEHLNPRGEIHIVLNSDHGDWWLAVKDIWQAHPETLAFSYIPATEFQSQLKEKFSVSVKRFSYPMQFPDFDAFEKYVRTACVSMKSTNANVEVLLKKYLTGQENNFSTQEYFSDIISLSPRPAY